MTQEHTNSSLLASRRASLWGVCVLALCSTAFALSGAGVEPGGFEIGPTEEEIAELTGPVSWADIREITIERCVSCHMDPGPAGGLDLTDPRTLRRRSLRGSLVDRLNDPLDPMPPGEMLSVADRSKFERWVAAGAPIPAGEERSRLVPAPEDRGDRPEVVAHDVTFVGFEFLERVQGHWVGDMELMGERMPWFAFDYRPIGPAQVHSVFEGGTRGNLMTSFFYARVGNVSTIVARSGGVLGDTYRTSYLVLERVREGGEATEYRFVDAIGGGEMMWMSLRFEGASLVWETHTSRMGDREASRHMLFQGDLASVDLAASAATETGFPERAYAMEFPGGLPAPDWGEFGPPTSASFLWESSDLSYEEMGRLAGDPVRIEELGQLSTLALHIDRGAGAPDGDVLIYLSREAFVDPRGRLRTRSGIVEERLLDGALVFSELVGGVEAFDIAHLHPGSYELTVVVDTDGDGLPGAADALALAQEIRLPPGGQLRVDVQLPQEWR